MHPIYFVCKLLSVDFQHCKTIMALSGSNNTQKNHINIVFLSLICRESNLKPLTDFSKRLQMNIT